MDTPEDVMKTAGAITNEIIRNYEENRAANIGRDSIARAIMAKREHSQWQPIKTAPKDGTYFLAVNADAYNPIADICNFKSGKFQSPSKGEYYAPDGWIKWWPTHWMPLPGAPE